jgi:hypothetical protein
MPEIQQFFHLMTEIGGNTSPGQEYKTILFTRPRDPSRYKYCGKKEITIDTLRSTCE